MMKFDQPTGKKQATAVVWEATITVMDNEGAMREFNFETESYDVLLEKLDRAKQLIESHYQLKRVGEESLPF